jgi:hypothetical protein
MSKQAEIPGEPDVGRRLPDFQRIHRQRDREQGSTSDLFFDFIGLTEGLGEVGRTLRVAWDKQNQILAQVGNREEAKEKALEAITLDLQRQLADLFSTLLRVANSAGIDLESAYIRKAGVHRS